MKLDLHCHSTKSDGSWPAERVAAEASRRRLSAWALTDHDTLAGYHAVAGAPGLICGVEISTWGDDREVHVVGLGVNPNDTGLTDLLSDIRAARHTRAAIILERVGQLRGQTLAAPDHWLDDLPITRSHIAHHLITSGWANNYREVFLDLIGDRQMGELPTPGYPTISAAAAVIHAAGGVAILAHPGIYHDIGRIERLMTACDGCEIKHPNLDPALANMLLTMANERGWLMSAGSDFHRDPCRLGDWRLTRGQARPLLDAVNWRDPITG
ncbi:MAG: hypothetical protein ACYTF0_05725 [Planctomycetota bacterium]